MKHPLHFISNLFLVVTLLFSGVVFGSHPPTWPLDQAPVDIRDTASQQRGAKYFVNYCQGCHGARYVRFNQLAKDIGIVDAKGDVLADLVKQNLMFNESNMGGTLVSALTEEDGAAWFGIAPPDLSLTARERGVDWLYTYLRSFYEDSTRPWGVNNAIVQNVAMPHALLELQGVQKPVFEEVTHSINGQAGSARVLKKLERVEPGVLTPEAYDKMVADLVNFLFYIGEPMQLERKQVGVWVILFLVLFLMLAYLTKKEYWKDIY